MKNSEKLIFPISCPSGGMITSSTSDETILPNAAPMMMPTAMSITNSLNSLSTVFLLFASMKAKDGPVPIRLAGSGRLVFERGLHPRREKIERHRNKRTKEAARDRKSTRLNSSHTVISYAVFCLKKKKKKNKQHQKIK